MNRHGLLLLSAFGLGGCQVIAGITDRTEGPGDAEAPASGGAANGNSGGASGSSPTASGGTPGTAGTAGKGGAATGSGGFLGGAGGTGTAGSVAAGGTGPAAGGGSSAGGTGPASGGGSSAGGKAGGAGGPSAGGRSGGGGASAANSGETRCSAAAPTCSGGQACVALGGSEVRLCSSVCTATTDCAAGHLCAPLPGGPSYCVPSCPAGTCTVTGSSCFAIASAGNGCIPDEWFFTKFNDPCTKPLQCRSHVCTVGFCDDCQTDSDCGKSAAGLQNVCGVLSGTADQICFHQCSTDAVCQTTYAEPGIVCSPGTTLAGASVKTCDP